MLVSRKGGKGRVSKITRTGRIYTGMLPAARFYRRMSNILGISNDCQRLARNHQNVSDFAFSAGLFDLQHYLKIPI